MFKIKSLLLLIFFILPQTIFAMTTFVYNNTQGEQDKRKLYEIEVINLALEKTKDKYGPYKLIPGPKMSLARAFQTIKENKIKNFLLKSSASEEYINEFAYSNFPVDRGVTGYRVAFVSPKIKNDINNFNSIEKIKNLTIGQGVGWLDTPILRDNGFKVKTISSYESLFYMVSLGRIDLFTRGINEVLNEYLAFKNIKKLYVDSNFILYYPLPRFFFTHKSNEKAMERIDEGLKIAFKDGSLDEIFEKYYKTSIEFLDIEKRFFYKIENPFIKNIDKSYEKYIFNPFKGIKK